LSQCRFLEASAEKLDAIEDESVDVVTTRAVLAYVHDKPAALREFYRILRPGGRISIAEPILQDHALNAIALRRLVESQTGTRDRFLSLVHRWKAAQFPDTLEKLAESPIANYSDQDLLASVVNSGFVEIDMELKTHTRNTEGVPWQTFLNSSPHPLAPTLEVIFRDSFSPDERHLFERTIRAMIEAGPPAADERVIYLSARKPIK
jgi:arsenite methyltransferase